MATFYKKRNRRQDKRLRELAKLARWRQRKAEIKTRPVKAAFG